MAADRDGEGGLSRQERRAFRRDIAPAIRAAVAQSLAIADPWELESLAVGLAGPDALGGLEDAYALEAVAMAAEEPGGRTLLAALAAVAPPPIAAAAAGAQERMAGREAPISEAGRQVGSLEPRRAWTLGPPEAPELVHLAFARPGAVGLQVVSFDLDREEGGALADAISSPPLPDAEVERFLGEVVPGAPDPEPVGTAEALALLLGALRACRAAGRGPTAEAHEALPLALRALGAGEEGEALLADVAELPLLVLLDEDDEGEGGDPGEDDLVGVGDALAEGFGEACAAEGMDPAAVDLATRVAREMAWSREEAGAGPLDWDRAAVRAFLLDHAAARLPVASGREDAVVEAAAQMLVYLGLAGLIDGGHAGRLAEEALSLREQFRAAARGG